MLNIKSLIKSTELGKRRAVLLLLVFLLTLRVRIILRVGDRTRVELRVLFLRFRLYPKRQKLKAYSPKKLERIRRRKAKKAAKKALKKQKKNFRRELLFMLKKSVLILMTY